MTVTERVDLTELDGSGKTLVLDDALADALNATGLVGAARREDGQWHLTPRRNKVGAVRVGGLDVQVRPKVTVDRMLFMLGYARNPGFRPEDVSAGPDADLWPALAESLIRHVERALAPGVLEGYVLTQDALPVVRGRIRLGDQFARRPGALLPLEVSFDDHAVDIPENQIIRTALGRMMAVPRLTDDVRARLGRLHGRLRGARTLPIGAAPPPWYPNRRNARYVPALRLADLIVQQQSAEFGPGGVDMAAFVVDMWKVFEDFVSVALREALAGYGGHTEHQYESHLDEEKRLRLRPDVVHLVDGKPIVVFDAKYKLESSSSRYPEADSYQMLAYCTALQVSTAWLVYAEGTTQREHRVRNSTFSIVHYPLDLSASPHDLLAQVADLAAAAMAVRPALAGLQN
ncbi:McrC family protein [Catellatospora paridis]|uniref:McrC family protein n=1 Tax=Catellatospora paridis TaxID=1617086 RepID=UPI0012D3918B|nr:restriction endonuclease [Catellatospora paridis]